jgi:putative endonuclease
MKQSAKKGEKNKIGSYGEDIAARYLEGLGFVTLDRNYLKKWGEIDVVSRETTQNKQIVHFVEVKTVSYETKEMLQKAVSYGTWRPEENVHQAKIQRMHRTIESWLSEHECNLDWNIDIIAVRIVPREKYASVKYIPNIIID